MHFQNFALANYFCLVVRPLNPVFQSHVFWITQTNGDAPCSSTLVTQALNFHFCAPSESFEVISYLPFVFSSLVASEMVKLHLVRIGIFALKGFIFRIHGDQEAALLDTQSMSVAQQAGTNSNFEMAQGLGAQQWHTVKPVSPNLPDGTALQLDSMTAKESMCRPLSNLGDHGKINLVKSTLSASPLNAPTCKPTPLLLLSLFTLPLIPTA